MKIVSSKNTHIIIIHNNGSSAGGSAGVFRRALETEPAAGIVFEGLTKNRIINSNGNTVIAIPGQWQVESSPGVNEIFRCVTNYLAWPGKIPKPRADTLLVISNGRFITRVDIKWLGGMLESFDEDLVSVNVEPGLRSYRENVSITSRGDVAGIRRLYSNSVLPEPAVNDWPHHIFIKAGVVDKVTAEGVLPLKFGDFADRCREASLTWRCLKVGGALLDMEIEGDILDVFANSAVSNQHHLPNFNGLDYCRVNGVANCAIADDARFFGMVLIGDNVRIGRNAIIVGPTRLGDNVSVGESATIRNSVIASDISVPRGAVVQNRVIFDQENKDKDSSCGIKCPCEKNAGASSNFRLWPIFSYVRFSKRIADIVVALIVLILFLPILPVLVLIIKLSSPGPAFFAHEREGMHEKRFSCLKFRTMIVEADRIQKGLRFKNQVDGPQFKVEDDPRITTVGRFLRETFIDEIPQFFNVLTGKMSVVGPRPSPKSENCICPFWREARLSVRPGITGLWQVRRTRLPGRDFQEWIYYDTKYVRDVSLRLDLIICWQTAKKLVLNFFNQF